MNPNICNNCGGDYDYRNGRWICRCCGAYKPEEISNEEVTLLYTASQKLRLAEFDEAEQEFDDIVRKYPENPCGYWGRLMSRYGIKYEEDFDGRRIPTCYATSIESIMEDRDYKKALEYADRDAKEYYTQQAEYIERVRREWVEKASKEEPYDIFICYKESDLTNGINRTQDSVAAQDLYMHLIHKGYRVFFSHESLRNKVGEKYEPYIFNALSTAKVMLVYASKPEYVTSTWLKNEWTRYEKRIRAGQKQPTSLLVACDGFSPADLPRVLSARQCFDATQRSFYSDLDEVITDIIAKETVTPGVTPIKKRRKKAAPIIAVCAILAVVIGAAAAAVGLLGQLNGLIPEPPSVNVIETEAVVTNEPDDGSEEETPDTEASDTENSDEETLDIVETDGDGAETEHSGSQKCDHQAVIDEAVDPTCDKAGKTEGSHCSLCGDILTQQSYIAPTGHIYSSGFCTVCGATEPDVNEALFSFTQLSDGTYSVKARNPADISGHVVVPDMYNGRLVTALGAGAFSECRELTSIDIPDSVTSIGANAFYYCKKLESITVPNGVTKIEEYTFQGCDALISVTLPDAIAGIDEYAFQFCRSMTDFNLPKMIRSIGDSAFYNCSKLESLTIPDTLRSIGWRVFGCCYGLVEITVSQNNPTFHSAGNCLIETAAKTLVLGCQNSTIPDDGSVTVIGEYAFEVCNGLKKIVIPEGVTTIERSVFLGCSKLSSIVLPVGLTSIGQSAFEGCRALTDVRFGGTEAQWNVVTKGQDWNADTGSFTVDFLGESYEDDENYSKGLSFTPKGDTAFYVSGIGTCTDTDIKIPPTYKGKPVTGIETSAFHNCSSLYSITIPDSVTYIGQYAFYNCEGLIDIVIPDSVTTIDNEAFNWCENLTSLQLSKKLTKIGTYAFANCEKLKSIVLPESLTVIDNFAFVYCTSLTSVTIPNGVQTIGNSAFSDCKKLTSVTIPASVTKIGERALQSCTSLTEIKVASGNTVYHSAGNCLIETRSKTLLFGCKSSIIPNDGSVTSIGNYAFLSCGLTSVRLPDGLLSIGELSFYYCRDLTSVVIPSSVQSIGLRAFDYCTSLSTIHYGGSTQQWNSITKGEDWDRDTPAYSIRYGAIQ